MEAAAAGRPHDATLPALKAAAATGGASPATARPRAGLSMGAGRLTALADLATAQGVEREALPSRFFA
jgi:hypothetical protein